MNFKSPIPRTHFRNSNGFTLVELLTAIFILGLLATIIIAVSQRAISAAETATCSSNLRMLHSAFMLATSDNNGDFPYEDSTPDNSLPRQWHRRISPYVDISKDANWRENATEIYLCQADDEPYSGLLSYGINRRFKNLNIYSMSGVGNPVLISDASSFEIHSTTSTVQHIRHSHSGDLAQMIFFDGSIQRLSEDEMQPLGEEPEFWNP